MSDPESITTDIMFSDDAEQQTNNNVKPTTHEEEMTKQYNEKLRPQTHDTTIPLSPDELKTSTDDKKPSIQFETTQENYGEIRPPADDKKPSIQFETKQGDYGEIRPPTDDKKASIQFETTQEDHGNDETMTNHTIHGIATTKGIIKRFTDRIELDGVIQRIPSFTTGVPGIVMTVVSILLSMMNMYSDYALAFFYIG